MLRHCTKESNLPLMFHCLSAGTDSFYSCCLRLQLELEITHTNTTTGLSRFEERHYPLKLRRTQEKQQIYLNLLKQKDILINNVQPLRRCRVKNGAPMPTTYFSSAMSLRASLVSNKTCIVHLGM